MALTNSRMNFRRFIKTNFKCSKALFCSIKGSKAAQKKSPKRAVNLLIIHTDLLSLKKRKIVYVVRFDASDLAFNLHKYIILAESEVLRIVFCGPLSSFTD